MDSCQPVTVEALIQYQTRLCGIYGGESSAGTGFLQVLQLSLASDLPPMLHTHLFITDI